MRKDNILKKEKIFFRDMYKTNWKDQDAPNSCGCYTYAIGSNKVGEYLFHFFQEIFFVVRCRSTVVLYAR